jgi:hypothetical protein
LNVEQRRKHQHGPLAHHITVLFLRTGRFGPVGLGGGSYPRFGAVLIAGTAWLGGQGVTVYSDGGDGADGYYQCVELINRLITTRGWSPAITGVNANGMYGQASSTYFDKHPNGSGYQPVPGDIVVWGGGSGGFGHVSVVDANSGGLLTVAEQNSSPSGWGTNPISASGTIAATAYGYYVEGFLHARANHLTGGGTGPGTGPPVSHFQPIIGDFNGDGKADIGLRDSNNGMFFIKHGPSYGDQVTYQWAPGANYQPFVGDFNADGVADIGLRDANNGIFYIKHGPSYGDQVTYQWAPGANYQPLVGDFNGDGVADIGLRDANNGIFYIKHGPSYGDQVSYQWAPGANYQPFVGDFNGDGKTDIGLRDVNSGTFFIKHGPSFGDQVTYGWAAGSNYLPLVGDFNGDGKADIGLKDQNSGILYFLTNQTTQTTTFGSQTTYQWAPGANYQAFVGDFNGDGVADIGLRDANNGIFYIKHGPDYGDQVTYQWAPGANYQAFVGDFNGDGVADIGLKDANSGILFFLSQQSTITTTFGSQTTYPWAAG